MKTLKVVSIIISVGVLSSALFLLNNSETKQTSYSVNTVVTSAEAQQPTQTTETVQTTVEPEQVPVQPSIAPTEPVEATETVVNSTYGVDPNNSSLIRVFDPIQAMTEAGIPASEFDKVDYIIKNGSLGRDWVIDSSGGITLFRIPAPSDIQDYNTNPVSQLRYANTYLTENFGNWDSIYTQFYTKRNFTRY